MDHNALNYAINEIEESYQCFEKIEFKELAKCRNIFMIKSSNINDFKVFVDKFRNINSRCMIYICAKSGEKEEIAKICKNNYEILEFKGQGNYTLEGVKIQLEKMQNKIIDKSIIFYNNEYGLGYENIEIIVSNVKSSEVVAFNCKHELLRILYPNLRISSLILYKDIMNWFWEYIDVI